MTRRRAELVILGILIIGIILYAGTGIVYSTALAAGAERSLNTVVSHENAVVASFNAIDNEVSALNGNANFDPHAAVSLVDQSVANSRLAAETIQQDDASLASVQRDMSSTRWLTAIGKNSIDKDSARITHARTALAAARSITNDEELDGHFWRSLFSALADLDTLSNQDGAGDFASARTTLATMKGDVDQATQQSVAPGLPADLHSLMTDLQTFVGDYGKQLDAEVAQDDAAIAQSQSTLESDRMKLGTYDIDKIRTEIDAFYKPLIVTFNSEMASATA